MTAWTNPSKQLRHGVLGLLRSPQQLLKLIFSGEDGSPEKLTRVPLLRTEAAELWTAFDALAAADPDSPSTREPLLTVLGATLPVPATDSTSPTGAEWRGLLPANSEIPKLPRATAAHPLGTI